uniref:Uncharacterized protein n=1 Tax=Arundo donax TaxID=35708 RepID=A0A0A9DNE7_ARUDO
MLMPNFLKSHRGFYIAKQSFCDELKHQCTSKECLYASDMWTGSFLLKVFLTVELIHYEQKASFYFLYHKKHLVF